MRAWFLVLLVGCGDNAFPDGEPLAPAANLTIVAHQDDDLLFMQPDVLDAALSGDGLTNVYVTAGNGRGDAQDHETVERRDQGLMAAYTAATGKTDWSCGRIELAAHPIEHCRLAGTGVSLVFLGYPDGGKEGEFPDSLLHLWEGTIDRATTIGNVETSYDRDELVAVLAAVIDATQPRMIRTLEIASTHGRDHSDHMMAGALALLAVAAIGSPADLISYRGYGTETEPENRIDPLFDRSANILAYYDACAEGCAACGKPCSTISEAHDTWLHRRYAVGRRTSAGGELRSGAMCATPMSDGEVVLTDCAAPFVWQLSADGLLRTGDRCMQALPTGELVAGHDCSPAPANRFVLDDEGHLWLGVPPFAQAGLDYAHLQCIGVSGGRLRAGLCGADHAPAWTFTRAPITTSRAALGLTAIGRAVRLADFDNDGLADLCSVEPGLRCVHGLGSGTFDGVLQHSLPVEPESLVIGDLDGDRRQDACGRDANGILCTDATTTVPTRRWTPAFGRDGAADTTDRSLALIDRKICGVIDTGLVCASHGDPADVDVRSSWPRASDVVWQADLDGDLRGDWCSSSPSGIACGLASERDVTTDGVPWGFSLAGVVDPAPTDGPTSALADIDGDGRADLCSLRDGRIMCARSQGHGFGPQSVFAELPAGPAPTALWLGDLDGDHRADACVDQGGSIVCFRAP